MLPTYADYDPILTMSTLLMMVEESKRKFKALPVEEQERITKERAREREEQKEQRRIENCLHQSICPNCGKKLIRGKKDKKHDYKRLWTCSECAAEFWN